MIRHVVVCLATLLTAASAGAAETAQGLAAQCEAAGNDDNVRGYDPSLRAQLLTAYRRAFPRARTPSQSVLESQTNIRCMDSHLLVCFTGANLPCSKMNQARDNTGANTFCRSSPNADVVPMVATGHDTIYAYRCIDGQARIAGRTFNDIDQRGFARQLWTPLSR